MSGLGIDGIGHYTQELRARLLQRGDVKLREFMYSVADGPAQSATNAQVVGGFNLQAAVSLLTNLGFERLRPLLREGVDLVHATDHLVPKTSRVPVIATLMDAIPLSNPEWVAFSRLKGAAWRRSMRWADRIITVSKFSRETIEEHFSIPASNIDVIPLGVDEKWFAESSPALLAEVAGRYELPPSYLLFVGTLQPRKNLEGLIRAHEAIPSILREAYPLLIVGRVGWGVDALKQRLSSNSLTHVRWLEYVDGADLPAIVALARALVLPSLAEGFGLPVLEAFAAGTAVIASNTTSIPEVAGSAALLVDPTSEDEIAGALQRVTEDDALIEDLEHRGRKRARLFTWDQTAELSVEAYRKLI
ncbi:MAG: glycosyltransferase family 1 protein [Pseudomonadota bacterium]